MTRQDKLAQKVLESKLQAESNARKSRRVIKAGANLSSQWAQIVTNEQRLIDNEHFMRTNKSARTKSKEQSKSKVGMKIVSIKRVG